MTTLTSIIDEKVSRIAEQVDGLGRGAAGSLHAAASSIRQGGQQGSRAIEDLAESTASKLDGAGSYVERHNLKTAMSESRRVVGRYPVESLLLAGGVGFLAGFAIRRLTHSCAKSVALGAEC
jgi:hypothetical protein